MSSLPGFTAEASLYKSCGHYLAASSSSDGPAGGQRILPQLQDDTVWTTDKVCTACGCTVSGFTCNCGLRPRPDKLECIRNGGPKRSVPVLIGSGLGTNVFQRR